MKAFLLNKRELVYMFCLLVFDWAYIMIVYWMIHLH